MTDSQGRTIERRALFHAEALGFAAQILRPERYYVESLASSVLAITGGLAEARAEAREVGIFSLRSAATRVLGEYLPPEAAERFTHGNYWENDLSTHTVVQAALSGLKVEVPMIAEDADLGLERRVFVAEELEATMESTNDRQSPNAFRGLRALFRGISVDGYPLIVETNTELFTDKCTKRKLDCAMDDAPFRKSCSNQIIGRAPGLTLATVVTELRWERGEPRGTEIRGNRLRVRGLGYLYFGELEIEDEFRRLTLVRGQLGCKNGGSFSGPTSESNTVTYPPLDGGT
jgi:hypothetical protein